MKKSIITINIDEDIRNQDWLKRPDELKIHDMVSAELKKRHIKYPTQGGNMENEPLTKETNHADVDINPLVFETVVDAPLSEVWEAWSTSEGLSQWMAPLVEIDLQVGGLMRSNYNQDGKLGDPQTIINTILSFEPQRMISIKVAKAPEGFPFPHAISQMWSIIYFSEVETNKTSVREVSLGFSPDLESQKMRAFFNTGNSSTLSQFKQYIAKKAK
jgi:uncharacterized protein YndB with AHSA1/START domain